MVVSDLHLGAHTGRDLLRAPAPRRALARALGDVERLVLLGDLIELRHGPVRRALSDAEPVLRELAAALPAGAEVVIVPGNHDHELLRGWLERRARDAPPPGLGVSSPVDWVTGDPLARIAHWLAPAVVRAAYPGVWLREDVYATHGHYGDRHTTVPMFERLGAGAMARVVRERGGGPRSADDYEAVLAPLYAWMHAIAQRGGPELGTSSHGVSAQAWRALGGGSGPRRAWRRRALGLAFPVAVAALNRAGIGPLHADISGAELRRAALRATGEVIARLGIQAPYVVFGHTHRAGPLATDAGSEWRTPGGTRLLNSGCWIHEPGFIGPRPSESPYRAGFAAVLGDSGPPELVNLLDGVSRSAPA